MSHNTLIDFLYVLSKFKICSFDIESEYRYETLSIGDMKMGTFNQILTNVYVYVYECNGVRNNSVYRAYRV